jgi:hypothetical protein
VAVEAELVRRTPAGTILPWFLNEDGTEPVADAEVRAQLDTVITALANLLAELSQKYEGGAVELSPASLEALESITSIVSGTVAVSNFPPSQPVTGPLTDGQLRAAPVPVSFEATEDAGLTDSELRASPVPVSGTVSVNEPVTVDGTVAVTGALTDAQLRAAPISVSFPADESGLTDAQLRASPVPVSFPADEAGLTNAELRASAVEVTVANPTTNPETGLAKEATVTHMRNKFAPGLRTTQAATFASVGDNVVYAPAAGKKVRLHWLGMSSSQNNDGENKVTVKFGPAGQAKYIWRMGNPGAFSHWEPIDGAVGEAFIVNLATTDAVDVNYTLEEI